MNFIAYRKSSFSEAENNAKYTTKGERRDAHKKNGETEKGDDVNDDDDMANADDGVAIER